MQTIKRRIDYGRTARALAGKFTGTAPSDTDGLPDGEEAPEWEITPAGYAAMAEYSRAHGGRHDT
jgi:hypothetical protein